MSIKKEKVSKPAQRKPAALSKAEQRVEQAKLLKEKAEVVAEGVKNALSLREVLRDRSLSKELLDRMVEVLKTTGKDIRKIASEY